jgi:hypothetical protein
MTDHIHGEDSYVECDRFHVVTVTAYEDHNVALPEKHHLDYDCYCGADATHYALVGFTTYKNPPEERDVWPKQMTQRVNAHRCDKHSFEEDNA